jgi:predicted DNA-binding transcriptional regulator
MITSELTSLGFSEKEIQVYLCVLQHGRIAPANIARLTKINRSTVYFIVGDLITRGVIAEDTTGPTSFILALPPEELLSLIDQEERQLQRKREQTRLALPELQRIAQDTRYVAPRMQFVTKEQLEAFLHRRTPEWNASIAKRGGAWWGFQDPSFLAAYGGWITWYWQQESSRDVHVRLLTNQNESEDAVRGQGFGRRETKLWAKSAFTGTQWIAGDYVVNIITAQEPHYLVEIRDAVMAGNLREMFKGMWLSPT